MRDEVQMQDEAPKKNNSGFTLVELMVVIVIMGILTAVAIPVFKSQVDKARVARILTPFRESRSLMEIMLADGTDPSAVTDTVMFTKCGLFNLLDDGGDDYFNVSYVPTSTKFVITSKKDFGSVVMADELHFVLTKPVAPRTDWKYKVTLPIASPYADYVSGDDLVQL